MKRFEKHIFVCENKRPDGHPKGCCADKNSMEVRAQFKKRLNELGISTEVRSNSAGCLDACEHGSYCSSILSKSGMVELRLMMLNKYFKVIS